MGCMGLGLDDFCCCTPSEFWKIYESWQTQAEYVMRDNWEQTRVLCASMLQPYIKKRLSGRDVFPLPWDGKKKEEEHISKKERDARYEAAKKRYGIE